MNAEYINPFIQGSQNVLNMVCSELPSLGKLFVKEMPYTTSPVTVAVSIIGDIKGTVVYNMKEGTGCYIASKMMYGMPVPVLDEMSQSALSELANMISGNVATVFESKGITIDITPPRFLLNAVSADFPSISDQVICIPVNLNDGYIFEIDVQLA